MIKVQYKAHVNLRGKSEQKEEYTRGEATDNWKKRARRLLRIGKLWRSSFQETPPWRLAEENKKSLQPRLPCRIQGARRGETSRYFGAIVIRALLAEFQYTDTPLALVGVNMNEGKGRVLPRVGK